MHRRSAGFTYLALLFAIAVAGVVAELAATTWSTETERWREAQLLRTGREIRAAIGAYYEASPGAMKRYPPTLEALLQDTRQAGVVRYLRRIPRDPMSDAVDWKIVRAPDGGVMGVVSPSTTTPVKRVGYAFEEDGFARAARISEWEFLYRPGAGTH